MNSIAKLGYASRYMNIPADVRVISLWAALGLAATALIVKAFGLDLALAMAMAG
jgi:hypothetical protein